MCEYDTLDYNVNDGTNFWTVSSYYLCILALMSLTNVLMILLILTIRGRDDLDFILIKGVTFLSYELDWIG